MLFEYYRHNIHLNSLCKPTISKALWYWYREDIGGGKK
jgi:hypothetical protein